MEHQYRSFGVESTSFLEDLNDPGSCSYTAHQNNANFTGNFQQQAPGYYGYDSRFNIPQQQPIRYDPKMYTNAPLSFSNPELQYDCNNIRQRSVAPGCNSPYDRPEYTWDQNVSYPSSNYSLQQGDARFSRPHCRTTEVQPHIGNQFVYCVPTNQNPTLKPSNVVPSYLNGSKESEFQAVQTQSTVQPQSLQNDLTASYTNTVDSKSQKVVLYKEDSTRICDRLSQLYRLSSTSPSIQQEINFLQEQLKTLESPAPTSEKSSIQAFYSSQNCNDKTLQNMSLSTSQLVPNSSSSPTYSVHRYFADPKLIGTNCSNPNLRAVCSQSDTLKGPQDMTSANECTMTSISPANASHPYVITPCLQEGSPVVSDHLPVHTVISYSTVQSTSNSPTVVFGDKNVPLTCSPSTACSQSGNICGPSLITSQSSCVNSCISSSCLPSFRDSIGVSNGFLESTISQQSRDSLTLISVTLPQNNLTLQSSLVVPRNHQTLDDSQSKSISCNAGDTRVDYTKLNMCASQTNVVASVNTCPFPLSSDAVQHPIHGSTIHYRQAENNPDIPYNPLCKSVSESSCTSVSSVTPGNFSQVYPNYGQYVSFTQESRPNLNTGNYWNLQYQGASAELIGQHLQPIAPAVMHSIVGSGSQCIEINKFSNLNCNDISYASILPKTTPTEPQPVKKTRGRKPRNHGSDKDKQPRRPKKSHEVETPINEAQLNITPGKLIAIAPQTKRPRGRAPKKYKTDVDSVTNFVPDPFAIEGLSENIDTKDGESLSECKKRRASIRPVEVRKKRKYRKSLKSTSELAKDTSNILLSSEMTSPNNAAQLSETITKQVKVVRARPRPKKRRPLPTLIKRKRRSAFYGDDSGSEPDVSSRLGSRISEIRIESEDTNNAKSKRRSERNTGDRKSYTDDLQLNLSDDERDAQNGEMVTLNDSADITEDVDTKIVESVLGRRITKRLVKKITETEIISSDNVVDKNKNVNMQSSTNTSGEKSQITVTEEEEEEEVEEFYLKYKSYSYLHCEWRALDEITDPRIFPKIRRFEMKQASSVRTEDDDVVLFNPDYVEVERVLDVKVYSNGQLVPTEKLERESGREIFSGDPFDLKRYIRRNKERSKVRNVSETRCKIKSEAPSEESTIMLPMNAPESVSEIHSTTPLTEDFPEGDNNVNCPPPSNSNAGDTSSHISQTTLIELDLKSTDTTCPSPIEPMSSHNEEKDGFVDISDGNTSPAVKQSDIENCQLEAAMLTSKINTDDNSDDKDEDGGTCSPVNVTYYLVKWRSLAYEDATWELSQDVDPTKVKEFYKRRYPPKNPFIPRDSNYKIIRPDPSTWKPIDSGTIYKNNNKLRDYQVEGVNWLTFCWYHHRNCILADEMGLGKTVQSVTFLLEIFKANVQGPFLIIVPLSTVGNWQREFENWSDFNVIIYHGSSVSRSMIQEYEMFYRKRSSGAPRHDVYKFHVVVTTFEVLMNDIEFFGQIHWAAAVIDEAHRLKNKKCKLGEGLRYLDLDHRVLLTGTPLQNNVEELFGLLNFLEPEKFSCATTFVAEYGELKTEEQVERLKTVLKPMMLRRLKEDVEKSLAPKEETVVEVELTNIQKKYYRAIMERNFSFLCKGSSTNAPNLMNIMMELRKCCNHPFLIKGAEDVILSEFQSNDNTLTEDDLTFQTMVYASGKLVLIHKLLPKLRADGHKVLIFSQMIRVLDILEDYLVHQGFQFERIDGRIHGSLRQEAIDRFSVDPDKFVFLLCTKAGGLGINLTAADVVIIYDSDWNPQNDLQAQARCHRIGQQKMVKVYRLITRNTYEREMFDRASLKLGLDRAVLQSMGSKEARQAQMTKKEIEDLLKKGAYGALMDDDKAGEDFCEEDIDQILQSRARVVQLEQGKENSTFSKATFSMSDNRSDIALDDPNFWQKWAKKAGVDETALTMKDLIVQTPRQRRQTSRYSSMMVSEPSTNIPSPASFNMSDFDDNGNSNSSGDDTVIQCSSGRIRSRRNRRTARNSRKLSSASAIKQEKAVVSKEPHGCTEGDLNVIEPLDRADLFRVERCLLTWSWGQWEQAISSVSFKRTMLPSELAYFSCALLDYTLQCLPPNSDVRTRAICEILARPGTWKLDIHQVNSAVLEATAKIKCVPSSISLNIDAENFDGQTPNVDQKMNRKDDLLSSELVTENKRCLDSPAPSDYNATGSPVADDNSSIDPSAMKLTSDDTDLAQGIVECTLITKSESCELIEKNEIPDKDEDDIDEENPTKLEKTQISPRLATFKPELLLPSESFKKHVQRAGARLLNRVALLFFLQCDIIGIHPAQDLISSKLSHTDFVELASSLPPLEALDSDLPAPWWDACCDKCLLLGIMKHGWEKYTAIRLDPKLCFRSRAVEMVQSQRPTTLEGLVNIDIGESVASIATVKISNDDNQIKVGHAKSNGVTDKYKHEENKPHLLSDIPTSTITETPSVDTEESVHVDVECPELLDDNKSINIQDDVCKLPEDVSSSVAQIDPSINENDISDDILLALPFPQLADLNSRARKLVGFFQRIKSQMEADPSRYISKVEVEESTCPPVAKLAEPKILKWTRREEADFYRVVSSFGVEFTEIPPTDNDNDNNNEVSKADTDIADPLSKSSSRPIPRIYSWVNFRQLANLSRKSDQALVEYFQAFYRMCQRVCKKELTVFAEPASTIATTTTSGSSDLGDELVIDPISEERASRCLSRIDLLVRIRNNILRHPDLEERLKLCQSSTDLPGWWIPGRHDKELLFAASKHGLARTDLNILQDPDSSFSRIVQLIRDKLTHDPAVTGYPGDLSANQANRSNIAAAAASAARFAAAQLLKEKKKESTCLSDIPLSLESTIDKVDIPEKLESSNVCESQLSIISTICQEPLTVKDDNEADSITSETIVSQDVSTLSAVGGNIDNDAPSSDVSQIIAEKNDFKITTKEEPSDSASLVSVDGTETIKMGSESAVAEWSIKFATNLAISWPKDRTVQHRLELICQTVETNEWPNPRRFITPITTSIPVSSSMANSTRSHVESKVTSLNSSFPQNYRGPASRDNYSLPSCNSRRIPMNSTHISLARKQYGLSPFSTEITTNSLDSAYDLKLSNLADMSPVVTNNELDESRQFDFSLTGRHINSSNCKPPLQHSYPSETLSSTPTPLDSDKSICSTSANIPLNLNDTQLSFVSNPTSNNNTLVDRNRSRSRNRNTRSNSIGKNISTNRDKCQTNSDSDQETLTFHDNNFKCTTSHSEHFIQSPKSLPISAGSSSVNLVSEDNDFSMPPPSMASAPRSVSGTNNRGRKRKNDASKPPSDSTFTKAAYSSKRERLSSSKTDSNDAHKTPQNVNSDIWDVRVPVISLVDGSLIYGDKAPERRSLESWLDANPNYMPYSVEVEDRAIYNRVASARGQDTSNMETLAYKHYLNSLLASAAAGIPGSISGNSNITTSNSPSSVASQVNNFNIQQYLQQQQQQLLNTFGAYARHPAYANLIASALSNWQSVPTPSSTVTSGLGAAPNTTKSRAPVSTSCTPSTSRSSKSRSTGNRSENSNRRRDSTEVIDSSPNPQSYPFVHERNSSSTLSMQDPFQLSVGNQRMDSMLNAVYQQAAAMNLAYMCNPVTAAALYSQLMLACSGSAVAPDIGSSNINLTSNTAASQQATLASLYANYLLTAKQMQQRQITQQTGNWDSQQFLASLASTLMSACGGSGDIDTTALLSMFSGAANSSLGIGTTSTPVKHSNVQQQSCTTQPDNNKIHSIPTSPTPTSDLISSVCSERDTQDVGDNRQTVSCRHSDQSQDKYDNTKEYEESQTILDLSK
ncbi:Chromodomain-helicase-DNA-binding protein 7 [Schistosoma japonicum]|nr:Chromodomain-helicase-DNA-binding protein 7 [Schistosoma japonicum]